MIVLHCCPMNLFDCVIFIQSIRHYQNIYIKIIHWSHKTSSDSSKGNTGKRCNGRKRNTKKEGGKRHKNNWKTRVIEARIMIAGGPVQRVNSGSYIRKPNLVWGRKRHSMYLDVHTLGARCVLNNLKDVIIKIKKKLKLLIWP